MLKRILVFLSITAAALLLYAVFAENIFGERLSPKDTAKITLNDLELNVAYNRPSKRDREIFGALVPYNQVWRTGANEATTFETNKDLSVNSIILKKGKYTLWTVPKENSWKIMFNSKQYKWGVNEKMKPMWDPNFDAVEIEVPKQDIDEIVEKFTIAFDNKTGHLKLTMAWDQTLVEIPLELSVSPNL